MKFDYTGRGGCGIDFGILSGNEKIIFIKAGLGGSHVGEGDKYLRLAHRLRDAVGCSVIAVSNPEEPRTQTDTDRAILEGYIKEMGLASPHLLFFGHSNGGIKGLELGASGIPFERMVLTNMPLMINFHKTKRYISLLEDTAITIAYGSRDPSYSYIPFIEGRYKNLRVLRIEGADHGFTGMEEEQLALGEILIK